MRFIPIRPTILPTDPMADAASQFTDTSEFFIEGRQT